MMVFPAISCRQRLKPSLVPVVSSRAMLDIKLAEWLRTGEQPLPLDY